jgi:branched-chain amino acid aminotransferase
LKALDEKESTQQPEPVCWLDGELMAADQARIPVLDHGLLYGDGVFEGIRFYHGRAFRLDEHLRRLRDSAQAIALTLPHSQDALAQAVHATIAAYGAPSGYVRLVVTRGSGPLGLDPGPCKQPCVIIIAAPLQLVDGQQRKEGIRLIIAATRRLPPDGLDPRIKSLNYLNHILARLEANHAGAQEAILLNGAGRVAEGSADNIFCVRRGRLYTPPVTDGALDGITRRCILELAASLPIPVSEDSLTAFDLYTADEVFLTGTGAELIPVREIDGRRLSVCPGPIFTRLSTAFQALIAAELS